MFWDGISLNDNANSASEIALTMRVCSLRAMLGEHHLCWVLR